VTYPVRAFFLRATQYVNLDIGDFHKADSISISARFALLDWTLA